uniref:Uncharacterized protein n=1 Tax=Strombidium inclinatum TaxID=197538 RepID=A0A7S3IGG8_9SPIT|mmetsp:Transcript_14194/g.22121  ORF Transcript_14194/g.22121 Transcript_14194/m.22121 type:complete len:129 (+) Transcript_14194:163-549(+)
MPVKAKHLDLNLGQESPPPRNYESEIHIKTNDYNESSIVPDRLPSIGRSLVEVSQPQDQLAMWDIENIEKMNDESHADVELPEQVAVQLSENLNKKTLKRTSGMNVEEENEWELERDEAISDIMREMD